MYLGERKVRRRRRVRGGGAGPISPTMRVSIPPVVMTPATPGVTVNVTGGGTATPATGSRPCAGWESDPQSFGKVVAEHHVRTVLGRNLRGNPTWCNPAGKLCQVDFPDGISVMVSFVKVPDYVIARERGKDKPRREYTYECLPNGRVIFRPR